MAATPSASIAHRARSVRPIKFDPMFGLGFGERVGQPDSLTRSIKADKVARLQAVQQSRQLVDRDVGRRRKVGDRRRPAKLGIEP
jgi:hypothetical protein